jgi:two-component system response regulator HydG
MPTTNSQVLAFRPQRPATCRTPDVLLGPSPAIARVWSQVRRVAPYFRTALLTGEPGAGHAAVANALHRLSPLSKCPFTTIATEEAEAHLKALPRFARETLFFPELEQLSPAAQLALSRLLRTRRQQQVTVIAAAAGDLRPLVSSGVFSGELAAALSALHIPVPSLRSRREDIPAVATHLLALEARAVGLEPPFAAPAFMEALAAQPWPANLDQLQTALHLLIEQFPDNPADPAHLQTILAAMAEAPPPPRAEPTPLLKLEEVVQQHIRGVLLRCNGNKLRAAEVLGISRSTLYRMLDHTQTNETLPLAG